MDEETLRKGIKEGVIEIESIDKAPEISRAVRALQDNDRRLEDLRDRFAGLAMAAYIQAFPDGQRTEHAEWAYENAAAMLEERKRRG